MHYLTWKEKTKVEMKVMWEDWEHNEAIEEFTELLNTFYPPSHDPWYAVYTTMCLKDEFPQDRDSRKARALHTLLEEWLVDFPQAILQDHRIVLDWSNS